MAFEKEIAHHLYSAYEVYLDLKTQLHDLQLLRQEQLLALKEENAELALLEDHAQQEAKSEPHDNDEQVSSSNKKLPPTIEDHEQQVHKDLDSLAKKIESLVQLLTQNHTTAATMLGEFENLRTFKIMSGDTFVLNGVLPLKAKTKK